ncbi:cytochrome b5-like heme/Steroid binding domain-containing protein [Ditylenchus destructor]|uniref:Cytochrome b5-like heme/Steroid binding domain-containing protein n=1 Tax=Ditylenchus destructor TaxID=166010 RepID=A0AAD4RD42_9BILA|nr:cytochrome b5-like heme/Steroid binding domain-containing protein [Ditylenchus destructor]
MKSLPLVWALFGTSFGFLFPNMGGGCCNCCGGGGFAGNYAAQPVANTCGQPSYSYAPVAQPVYIAQMQPTYAVQAPQPLPVAQPASYPQSAFQMAEEKYFTMEEVSKHNSSDSVWIIIEGKVYDVTKFIDEHPGGSEVILENAGEECTEAFKDIGHSSDAVEMREEYLIGHIIDASKK